MKEKKSLLVSVDYRVASGGISRVAHLINQALRSSHIFSLYGKASNESSQQSFFGGNRALFILKVVRKIIFTKYDIIVFDHLGVASLLVFIPKIFLKQVVIFLHDEEAWVKVKGRQKKALQKAHILLTNSQYTYKLFVKHNFTFKDKTNVCLLGGVPEKFEEVTSLVQEEYNAWLLSKSPYLVFVSRLWSKHRYKGHWELLNAYKKLNEIRNFDLRLAIIGRGDDADLIKHFIDVNNLSKIVGIFTNVSDHDLALFYQKSSGLIFPSIREGFGLVFLEAMYFRKAAIGVINQPAEEIIIHNETGLLLNDNSPETLVNTLSSINLNQSQLKIWGDNAYEHYKQNFTKEMFIKRFLQILS